MQALNTVTVKLQVAVFPDASVAVQVTVFVPIGNVAPDSGLHNVVTPGQLSVAVGVKFTATPLAAGQVTAVTAVILAGQVIVGGCVSMTVMVKAQLAVLPEASATEQVTVVVPTGKNDPDAGEH